MGIGRVRALNTILYCAAFAEAVEFYERRLGLPVVDRGSWLVELEAGPGMRISVADERRCSVKSAGGAGVTLTLEVDDADAAHRRLTAARAAPGAVEDYAGGARRFFVRDPEGNRVEIWSRRGGAA